MKIFSVILIISISFYCDLGLHAQEISEICPSNKSNYYHQVEGYSDWIELHNPTSNDINLQGYSIVDNNDNAKKWTINDTVIIAGGFLVIPANATTNSTNSIDFNFSKNGGSLSLVSAQNTLIDEITYPRIKTDHSYGRLGYFYDVPTPENDNQLSVSYKGYAEKPTIKISTNESLKTISLNSDQANATIFYSLNGSNPINGNLYTGPFISTKNTSIKAVSVCDSFLSSDFLFYSIFYSKPYKLPIVNLIVDSLALFDSASGIYMLGPNASILSPFIGANFWGDIEVDAHYAYYNNDGQLREERECVMKMHGGLGSRTKAMKPLELIIHDYHDDNTFDYPYFIGKEYNSYSRLILRNSGNDFNSSMLRDGMIHNYIEKHQLDVDVVGYHPVVLYINGNYWGIHNIREKIGKHYIESNYQQSRSEINILENNDLTIVNGSDSSFIKLINFIESHELSNENDYNWVAKRLDINSMVDYFIVELFIYNKDWPDNNIKLWNSVNHPKWRYLCYDLDVSLNYFWGIDLPDKYYLKYLLENSSETNVHVKLLKKLLENSEFERYFINRYADLLNTVFKSEIIKSHVYNLKSDIELDMERHCGKWSQSYENWHKNVFYLVSFLNARVDIVNQELSATFNKPEAVNVSLKIYPYAGGEIQLNSILIDTFPFQGKYYPDNKIDIEAIAYTNHDFEYWINTRTDEKYFDTKLNVNPTESDEFIAIYSSNEDVFNLITYPNPVVDQMTINFSIPEQSNISIQLYDLSGRLIYEVMESEPYGIGAYEKSIHLNDINSGIYILSLKSQNGNSSVSIVKY